MSGNSIAIREPLELLTEIANTLAQDGAALEIVWLCEGPDDSDALKHLSPAAAVFVAGNRQAVLDCAEALAGADGGQSRRWELARELTWFLVDRDYEAHPGVERVLITEYCSLEADLLAASDARAVRTLVLGISNEEALSIASRSLVVAAELGSIRRCAHLSGAPLRFRRFPVHRVLVDGAVSANSVSVVLHERHPDKKELVERTLADASLAEAPSLCDQLALANGHDLTSAVQALVNAHPSCRDAVSLNAVLRALVTTADPNRLDWLNRPYEADAA